MCRVDDLAGGDEAGIQPVPDLWDELADGLVPLPRACGARPPHARAACGPRRPQRRALCPVPGLSISISEVIGMIQVFAAQQLVVSCRQLPSCNDRRVLSTITASMHSMSRGRLCARAMRSRGVCRAATPLSATNSAAPCWPPILASPRPPAGKVRTVSLASAAPAAKPPKPLQRLRRFKSWHWRPPTRPASSSTSVTACAPCSRACLVPPRDPTRLHALAGPPDPITTPNFPTSRSYSYEPPSSQ